MRIALPWLLVLIPPSLAIVVLVARNGRRTVPLRQHNIATGFRAVGVVLLILALAQPALVRASGDRTVLFLLDRSSSISTSARAAQEAYVRDALGAAAPTDAAAIAVFGKDLRLDTALSTDPAFASIRTIVDPTSTDLAAALLASAAVLPTEGSRRIVVLTDAVETTGNARIAAAELADQGIAVDVVTVETGRSSDALITGVDAPVTARVGDEVPVEIRIQATAAGPATVRVEAGDKVYDVAATLEVGSNRVALELPADAAGLLRVRATVIAGFDRVPENDTAEALVRVLGAPRVAVVAGAVGDDADVVRALEAGGIGVDRLAAVPGAEDLIVYDAVVLVDVPAPNEETSADLAAFVEDLGRGLVVVGGDSSYGLGDYQDSALEDLLPVTSDPDDLIRRQPVAEVLVIDTSGSMSDCHCDGISDHDVSKEGGINKTDISRAGAGLAIDALQSTDRVGLLAFTSGYTWAIPLGIKPGEDVIDTALASLKPEGDTEISKALRAAFEELKNAPEEIKHMVLFTDGWGDEPDLLGVAQDIAAAGITLSVLGTGEGTGDTLRRMAALGGGRYYPGRDLNAIPEIFVEETLRVARPLVAEGSFLPALGAASQVTAGLTAAPPLRGYVLTKAKDTAQVALEVGPGDPLLASWQRGLGRATAWTSDATSRWSADWLPWDGFVGFWGRLVRDALPAGLDTPPEVRLRDGALSIRFDADVPLDAVAVATVRDGAGVVRSVPLQRTGESTFEATSPVGVEGAYWVAVRVENADGVLASGSNGLVAGYADEFAFRDPDPALADDVAAATGGRVEPVALDAWEPAPLRGAAARDLWPFLAAMALALFLLDVVLRRLVVARGDLQVWRETLTPSAPQPVAALETPNPAPGGGEPPPPSREALPEEETLGRLLRRKRQ